MAQFTVFYIEDTGLRRFWVLIGLVTSLGLFGVVRDVGVIKSRSLGWGDFGILEEEEGRGREKEKR